MLQMLTAGAGPAGPPCTWPPLNRSPPSLPLTALVDTLSAVSEQEPLTVGALVEAVGPRGFGALLLLGSLLVVLPVGMVPGIPDIAAILMILSAGQMAVGRRRLWLPHRLMRVHLPARRLRAALQRVRGFAIGLDRRIGRRFTWFARSQFANETVAIVTIALCLLIMLVGWIPGIPAILCIPIVLFSLGLFAGNGLLILAGHVLTVGSLFVLYFFVR